MSYTPEMEAAVKAAAPFDLEGAKVLADTLGVTYRSVIAKAKSMQLEYIPKPAPVKAPAKVTKADVVKELEGAFGFSLAGLEKAPAKVLTDMAAFFTEG
jgi:hypothetical protein